MTYPSDTLESVVDRLRAKGFLPLVVPSGESDTDTVYQGLVRHHDGVVEVLVLRTWGPNSVLRARMIDDRSRPTALAEELLHYEELPPLEAALRMLHLVTAANVSTHEFHR